jgi:hypothetical protein
MVGMPYLWDMALCHEQFMRAPIKLNRSFWPKLLCRFLPSAADPRSICRSTISFTEFTQAVSVFKFGTTFKTSQKARFPLTIASLAELKFSSPPVILDVGASDGTTSLDVMQTLTFSDYFGPRSRRRPLSATQHNPTTSLVGISFHCHET